MQEGACGSTEREGCDTPTATRFHKKEIQDFARNNNIGLSDCREQIAPGWEGQPKGLLQVLGERGLIERDSLDKYTLDGRKDHITGTVDLQFSLRNIMTECADFKQEETALQHLGSQLGVTFWLTPKFHAEFAWEGVEYIGRTPRHTIDACHYHPNEVMTTSSSW